MMTPHLLRNKFLPYALLVLLITSYILYFSWYTINRHNTLNSYMADLSLIDQPMWNTVKGPGYFMELTWGNQQQPRLAEHFEPILVPLAMLFWLWDNVRILLIAQSVALALGALPVFWIAKDQLKIDSQSTIHRWIALAFAAVYLLFPHLQAANIADFHADPFVVTPLLFAFWYGTQRRWGWMWFWAIIAMCTKETLPTLTAMLGVWLLWTVWQNKKTEATTADNKRSTVIHGAGLIIISTIWFVATTYFIVAPLAHQYFGTDGPIYFANRYTDGLGGVGFLLLDPTRWRYVLGLLAAVGFLPLLAPELLVLGLPVLIANLLSNFPGQYSGEQHYSAPLVVAFVLAAIYGTRRLVNRVSLREYSSETNGLIVIALWLLMLSLAYHAGNGWTPLSTRTEHYTMSPAAEKLPTFIDQINADSVVSASVGVHPHLAHRRVIYAFPVVEEADTLLVDVTDIPGIHPNDAHAQLMDMLNTNWQVRHADEGLILAQKSTSPNSTPLPDTFYNFARTTATPTYSTAVTFGDGRLELLGYDLLDDPDDGVRFRFYWRTSDTLPDNLHLWPLLYSDTGQLLNDPTQVPMITTVWYPPEKWQPNEIVVTETLPQLLPDAFHLGIAIGPPNSFVDPAQRVPIINTANDLWLHPGRWAQLATIQQKGPFLTPSPPELILQPLTSSNAQFGPSIYLTGYALNADSLQPGEPLSVLLQWTTAHSLPADYSVFVHLLAADSSRVAQHDAYPTWLTPQPTSQWPPNHPVMDQHTLALPNNLPPGTYTPHVGLYNTQTMERLLLPNGQDTLTLPSVEIK